MAAVTIERILRQSDVPPLPPIYFRLHDMVNAPHGSSVADISTLIDTEPVLATHLLKIANSGLFDFPAPIDSIPAAVQAIGMPQIHDLVLAALVMEMFDHISPDIVSSESYWFHSIACGITSRILAQYRGEPNIERFFTAGLLHDIGSFLLYLHIPEQALISILHNRDNDAPLHHLERATVGFDHAQLGGALLSAWQLPAIFQETTALHHAPEAAMSYPLEVAVVHLADIMVNAMELGSRGEFVVPPLSPAAWDHIGLPVSILQPVMQEIDRQFICAVNAFY